MAANRFETACRIATVVGDGGVYTAEMPMMPRQDLVDVWWCALSAGRMLGIDVEVHTAEPAGRGPHGAMVVVEVRARRNAACA